MLNIATDEICSLIRYRIQNYNSELKLSNVGVVFKVGDGIVRVFGLQGAMAGELLLFEEGSVGIAFNLEKNNIAA